MQIYLDRLRKFIFEGFYDLTSTWQREADARLSAAVTVL